MMFRTTSQANDFTLFSFCRPTIPLPIHLEGCWQRSSACWCKAHSFIVAKAQEDNTQTRALDKIFVCILWYRRSADVAGRSTRVVRDDQAVSVPAHLTWVWARSPTGNGRFERARAHTRGELYSGLHHKGEAGASLLRVLPGARARGRKHGRDGVPRTKVQHNVRERERGRDQETERERETMIAQQHHYKYKYVSVCLIPSLLLQSLLTAIADPPVFCFCSDMIARL